MKKESSTCKYEGRCNHESMSLVICSLDAMQPVHRCILYCLMEDIENKKLKLDGDSLLLNTVVRCSYYVECKQLYERRKSDFSITCLMLIQDPKKCLLVQNKGRQKNEQS